MTPTLCENCEHVHDRKRPVRAWLCVKFPRLEGMGFVAPREWAKQEPYMRCADINGGRCPMFKAAKGPQMEAFGDESWSP